MQAKSAPIELKIFFLGVGPIKLYEVGSNFFLNIYLAGRPQVIGKTSINNESLISFWMGEKFREIALNFWSEAQCRGL